MGFSTPKKPFDLKDFLSQKGVPRSNRRPNWKRAPSTPTEETQTESNPAPADDAE